MISRTGKGGSYSALFLFLTIFSLSIFKINSYDLWWHIKAGGMIVGAGFKPAPTNAFSWAEPDYPWINFSWLFDVIVYSIYNAAGFNGLITFQAILVTAVFFFVYKTIEPTKCKNVEVILSEARDLRDSSASPQNDNSESLSLLLMRLLQNSSFRRSLSRNPEVLKNKDAGSRLKSCRDDNHFGLLQEALILALFLIAYFAARFRFSLRPHLLALLFFAIDIYLLNRLSAVISHRSAIPLSLWEMARVRVSLIAIPLIQVLWANVHGSAIIGVLLPGIFFIGGFLNPPQSPFNKGGRKGDFFLILLLAIAASLLNPYGYHILTDPFVPFLGQGSHLFQMLTIDEWQMPSKDMFFGWYGLLLAVGIASFLLPSLSLRERVRARGRYTDLLLFSTFAILSIKAVRFIDLFAVAAAPVIYKNVVSGQWSVVSTGSRESGVRSQESNSHPSYLILHPFLILSIFLLIGIKDTTFSLGFGVDEEVVPKKAVEFMERNGIDGRIFNSYNFGGYLIYNGYQVFIDGRLCYSKGLINEFADANLMKGWERVDEKYRPDIVLVEYAKPSIPNSLLTDRGNWALVYWDDLVMLFLRRSELFSGIISKNEYYLNPMDMYGRSSFPSPHPDPLPSRERGDILFWEEAIFAEAHRRIKEGPESMRAHLLLGNLYMSRGEADKAAVEYETVIKSSLSFGKAEAHNNLGTAYERIGDLDSAEMEYKRAIRLDKTYPLPQRNLGYLKLEKSEYIEALWHLDRYLRLSKGDGNISAIMYDLKRYRDILILRVFIGGSAIIGIIWIVARNLCRGNS
jgi:hypothetical protein